MTMQDEVKVREIETVAGDFLTEAGVPFYRVEIDGFCADFDYREAAENFANAINQMVARHRHQAERETLARMEWRPIDDCPMWELAIVTDGENVAKAQKSECDYGGFYWSIEPEDALEWEPTLWMPFTLPPAPEAA